MKQVGIYGLSQGDILEGMMTGQNSLELILLNKSADEMSGSRVVSWITYWRKDRTGSSWGGCTLKKLSPDDCFQLYTQGRPRLWTPPPAVIEKVVEVFNEYHL